MKALKALLLIPLLPVLLFCVIADMFQAPHSTHFAITNKVLDAILS
jgi:hypothetical protein